MDDECLIEEVRKFTCLWDVSTKAYKDIKARENAWKVVAKEIGDVTDEACMKRWKNLRDQFVRELRKKKKVKSGDPGPERVSRWPYFNLMTFISDTVRHRDTASNFVPNEQLSTIQATEDSTEVMEDEVNPEERASEHHSSVSPSLSSRSKSPLTLPPKRRRELDAGDEAIIKYLQEVTAYAKERRENKAAKASSPNMHFGLEAAARLDQLDRRNQAIAKVRIQQILLDVEYESPTPEYPPPSPYFAMPQYSPAHHHEKLYMDIP